MSRTHSQSCPRQVPPTRNCISRDAEYLSLTRCFWACLYLSREFGKCLNITRCQARHGAKRRILSRVFARVFTRVLFFLPLFFSFSLYSIFIRAISSSPSSVNSTISVSRVQFLCRDAQLPSRLYPLSRIAGPSLFYIPVVIQVPKNDGRIIFPSFVLLSASGFPRASLPFFSSLLSFSFSTSR